MASWQRQSVCVCGILSLFHIGTVKVAVTLHGQATSINNTQQTVATRQFNKTINIKQQMKSKDNNPNV